MIIKKINPIASVALISTFGMLGIPIWGCFIFGFMTGLIMPFEGLIDFYGFFEWGKYREKDLGQYLDNFANAGVFFGSLVMSSAIIGGSVFVSHKAYLIIKKELKSVGWIK